ncbi:MAG: LysM peptidoglycan-binding domain-containing protein [Chloroflexi bacterium]|nr:LysM peptidoglycan-binding domain-containing protein [Chloroflexota bacterium]MBA3851056.1 LysM peptidoglycan-binding domain-containing protein [Chloroflexota bacterium]
MSDRTPHHVQEPQACPFVALGDDRDRRLDVPDERHRCFAEREPQPRAIAHQDTYCLAPAFSACPIFLDWAARAAAEPIATRRPPPTPARLAQPDERSQSQRATDPAARGWAAPPPWSAEQLAAFDEPADPPDRDLGIGPSTWQEAAPSQEVAPPLEAVARHEPPTPQPSFLAGRSRIGQPVGSRPRALVTDVGPSAEAPRPSPGPSRFGRQARPAPPRRPQDAPEWSQPRRHEAYPTLTTRMGLRGTPPVAVAAVGLVLAALVLYLLPGLLAGGDPSESTPRPSQVAVVTPTPAPTPSPEPTPQVYTVVSGDNMLRIARMFGLTVEQIACFNAIEDVNRLQEGQELLIPEDDYACPGAETEGPAGETSGAPPIDEASGAP